MRKHKLDTTLKSNIDLTVFENIRVFIQKVGENEYRFTSTLCFYRCELAKFAYRFIKSRSTMKYFTGNCSSPTGIYF